MTTPRTIHRRNARHRARDDRRREAERFARLSPAQQEQELQQRRRFIQMADWINKECLELLMQQVRDIYSVSGSAWPRESVAERENK